MLEKPTLYKVKLGWDEKYIIWTDQKLNVTNDEQAKKAGRRLSKIAGFSFFEILVYREGKDLPEFI